MFVLSFRYFGVAVLGLPEEANQNADKPAGGADVGAKEQGASQGKSGDLPDDPAVLKEMLLDARKKVGDMGNIIGELRKTNKAITEDPVGFAKSLLKDRQDVRIITKDDETPSSLKDILGMGLDSSGGDSSSISDNRGMQIDESKLVEAIDKITDIKTQKAVQEIEARLGARVNMTEKKLFSEELSKEFPDMETLDPIADSIEAQILSNQIPSRRLSLLAARGLSFNKLLEERDKQIRESVEAELSKKFGNLRAPGASVTIPQRDEAEEERFKKALEDLAKA